MSNASLTRLSKFDACAASRARFELSSSFNSGSKIRHRQSRAESQKNFLTNFQQKNAAQIVRYLTESPPNSIQTYDTVAATSTIGQKTSTFLGGHREED